MRSFLLDFKAFSRPKETEILFGLLRGCDFNGMAPYMSAVTAAKDKIQILGFVNRGWKSKNSIDQHKIFDDFNQKDLKVLGVLYNEKHKERCEFQLYDPNELRLVSETAAPTHATNQMFKNQFKIDSEILNHLLSESELLTSVDEDVSQQQEDIYRLNTRTMLMKLINHQLQTNSEQFLIELKNSQYYQGLLKFVCRESSKEMKGDIMLLEWLEFRCFALRKYACENQQSLAKQKEVHAQLIKNKLYISYEDPNPRVVSVAPKQMTAVQLKSALNYKNFEEKKEVKLVHLNDVFLDNSGNKAAQKQIVLIDPESLLARANGLDILNSCEAAITYSIDLKRLMKAIFARQRTYSNKYVDLASKTVFLVEEDEYRRLIDILNSKGAAGSAKPAAEDHDHDNFAKIYEQELQKYGGFHPVVTHKAAEKESTTMEQKTEHLVKLAKQAKEGQIDLSEPSQLAHPEGDSAIQDVSGMIANEEQTETAPYYEERSEAILYLRNSFQQYLDRSHPDHQGSSTKDALFDAINSFSKKDIASEFEKTLIRLFNMYCRHVFWSLIQKDDINVIFSMIMESGEEMKAFATYLKVLGNECFITENKVYISSYKTFLAKVVQACANNDKYRPFLKLLLQEGLINCYEENLISDLINEQPAQAQRRIAEFFRTESKAAQLMNPCIVVPLLRLIMEHSPSTVDPIAPSLISLLVSLNCVFIGDYHLKDKVWELILAILHRAYTNISSLPKSTIIKILNLKVFKHVMCNFEQVADEADAAKRALKDSNNGQIDGIPRKETERLVYAKRALTLQGYTRFSQKDPSHVLLIEILHKLCQLDKKLDELQKEDIDHANANKATTSYRNNLMSHMDMYEKILVEGKDSKLCEYQVFLNHTLGEDQSQLIHTQTLETNHKEYDGNFTVKLSYPHAEKILLKINDGTQLRPGAAILVTSDRQGRNVKGLFMEQQLKKQCEQAFSNIYSDTMYIHYPVYPHLIFQLSLNEDNPVPQLLDQPLYRPLDRFEDQNCGKFFVTRGCKIYIWKNEELRRYKDHLDIKQVTFGKQCRVMLLENGKVVGEGRNKARHFVDSESEIPEVRSAEVPFYEKKDHLVYLSTFFQVTIAVSEKGKVFAVGDKIAQMTKIDNSKFGFFEIPLGDPAPFVPPVVEAAEEKSKHSESEANATKKVKKMRKVMVRKVKKVKRLKKQEEQPASQPEQNEPLSEAIVLQEEPSPIEAQSVIIAQEQEELAQASISEQLPSEKIEVEIKQKEEVAAFVSLQANVFQLEVVNQQLSIVANVIVDSIIPINPIEPVGNNENQVILDELGLMPLIEDSVPESIPELRNEQEQQPPLPNEQASLDPSSEMKQIEEEEEDYDEISEYEEVEVEDDEVEEEEKDEKPIENEEAKIANEEDLKPEEIKKEESSPQKAIESSEKQEADLINTEQQKQAAEPLQPDLFALRAWACKSVSTGDFVYLVMVKNNKNGGMLELRTLGHSQYGNLGQGPDTKQALHFKPISLAGVEPRSGEDIVVGYDNTFMVGSDGRLYGWGSYGNDDKHQFTPVGIKYFDKYDIVKIAGSQRTVALVTLKSDPSKRLIVHGKFAPFVAEDQVKTYELFQGLNIYNIQPYSDRLIVSILGSYDYKKPLVEQQPFIEKHSQTCEICKRSFFSGVLHFYKDPEGSFHYLCQKCLETVDTTAKWPDVVFAIKRPIADLETKPWPTYDTEALLQPKSEEMMPLYVVKCKINGKEVVHSLKLDEILEQSSRDMNPLIYIRIARPPKPEAQIEPIDLDQFYQQTKYNGISINVTPDYTFDENATALIEKNQQLYDEFRKSIDEVSTLSPAQRKLFQNKIEEFVAKKIKDQQLHEVKIKELKITDDTLKFGDEKLQELSEECKRLHIGKYLEYLSFIWGAFTYIYREAENSAVFSLLSTFYSSKHKIPLIMKNRILKKLAESLSYDDSCVSIHVNRKRAREFFDTGKTDEKGEFTVFAQVHKGLAHRNYQGMRINSADKKAWFVKFIGEFALDQGGLFRESLTELCQELQSHVLNLLVPTQNQKNCHGESRDKWTVNPGANTPHQLKMYEFLGALIGMSVRSGILMSLNLPSFVWKQLTDEPLSLEDLTEIDAMTVNILMDLKEVSSKMSEAQFIADYELNFTTILSNGEEVELIPGGRSIKVNFNNLKDYIDKTIKMRFKECKLQIKHIKQGIDITLDSKFLRLLHWRDLQYKVVGKDVIDIDRLKELTVYRNCTETHDTIKKLWKILNAMNNEERTLYLKFVWGRTRLPLKEEEVTENHTVQIDDNADLLKLPIGRTCFFRLEVPAYKSEEAFREKLLYAIRHCTVIDADIEGAVHNEEEQSTEIHQRANDPNDSESRRRRRDGTPAESEEEGGDRNGEDEEEENNRRPINDDDYEDEENEDKNNEEEDNNEGAEEEDHPGGLFDEE